MNTKMQSHALENSVNLDKFLIQHVGYDERNKCNKCNGHTIRMTFMGDTTEVIDFTSQNERRYIIIWSYSIDVNNINNDCACTRHAGLLQ